MLSIIATMSVSLVYCQSPLKLVKERVGNPDILKNWEVGDIKFVNQVSIMRQEGENNYDFITNVFYTPKNLIMNLIDEKSKAEAFLPDERNRMVRFYEASAPGGQIALFYCRPTKALAEPIHFSVRVSDESGNTLWTGFLDKEQPYYYRWEIWYFYKIINVPVAVGQSFIVQVYDYASKKSFKFRISQSEEMPGKPRDLSLRELSF